MKTIRNILSIIVLVLTASFNSYAAQIRWLQQPKVSPDGKWVVFGYKGNIYKVSAKGGNATALTSDTIYKFHPVWSHDSKTIAYASYQFGNADVFTISVAGGQPKRLTFDSANDIPYDFSADDQNVLFGSNRQELYTSIRFPVATFFMKVFEVPVTGGNSRLISGAGMENAQYNKGGTQLIFEDRKNFEDTYRKHQVSTFARDIWVYDLKQQSYKKLTSFIGEDREPVWGDGNSYYYLSERAGSQNVFRSSSLSKEDPIQLTSFTKHPVRSLSRSTEGTLCFSYNGDIYTLDSGKKPKLLTVDLEADKEQIQDHEITPATNTITELTVSKDGQQLAFAVKGDIFVCAADGSHVKQLTNTPFQERMPDFSPDGRRLIYSVENEQSWDIVEASCTDPNCQYLYQAEKPRFETVIGSAKDEFQGKYSPDGKKIAYLEEREILKSYNLSEKTTHLLVPEGVNFSNHDGSQYFTWSPDSQYLLYESTEGGGGYDNDIALLKDDGSGKRINLTKSGFKDDMPKWGLNGSVMYWLNDSKGLRSFTSESQTDVMAMFFDKKTWYNFHFSHQWPGSTNESNTRVTTPFNAKPDSLSSNYKTERLTPSSEEILDDQLTIDGKILYTLEQTDNGSELWKTDTRSQQRKLLAHIGTNDGKLHLNEKDSTLLIFGDGSIMKVDIRGGKTTDIKPQFRGTQSYAAERAYLFSHIWKVKKKRLLFPDLNHVDFDAYYQNYKKFLPYINNNFDFQILVNEFLGELNLSHNFMTFFPELKNRDQTAVLGLTYDLTRKGQGLFVKSVLSGGPFDKDDSHMQADMLVDSIDGLSVNDHYEWQYLLNHKSGKSVRVSYHPLNGQGHFVDTVIAVSQSEETSKLLYSTWIKKMEHLTDSLSGGKLGYVYLRQMDDDNFRTLYSAALGKYKNKAGLVVDTRFNRGGSLHDPLITFLTGKLYLTERREGRITNGGESTVRWTKPSCVVMNEGNYSDGFLFPYVYKELNVGKLIGMPTAGTGTQVWYEEQLDDEFGLLIPQGGTYGIKDTTPTENRQLYPDIQVIDAYENILNGKDEQIEAAVKDLLKTVMK